MKIEECVYEVVETNQGQVLIAECVMNFKIVVIFFIDNDLDEKILEMHDDFPTVHFIRGSPTQTALVVNAINTLNTDVKVNVCHKSTTEFSMKVYEAIKAIPKGEKRSYSEIAEQIGNPQAYRAVARTCATNNLAYIVPCHRVIASNGALSGYRWGLDRKRRLLLEEGVELTHAVM